MVYFSFTVNRRYILTTQHILHDKNFPRLYYQNKKKNFKKSKNIKISLTNKFSIYDLTATQSKK